MCDPLLPPLTYSRPAPAPSAPIKSTASVSSPPPAAPTKSAAATTAQLWLESQLRHHLPQAQPLRPTLERWCNALVTTTNAATPPDLKQSLLTAFIQHLPTAKDLVEPQRLATTLQNSGVWLEAALAQELGDPSVPHSESTQDFKAQLLCLAEELRALADAESLPVAELAVATAEQNAAVLIELAPEPEAETPSETDETDSSSDADELEDVDAAPDTDETETELDVDADDDDESAADGDDNAPAAHSDGDESAEAEAFYQPLETLEPVEDEELPVVSNVSSAPAALPLIPERAQPSSPHPRKARAETLLREIDGMIKQVVTHQLHSLDADPNAVCWLLEVPFRVPSGELLTLDAEIERQTCCRAADTTQWTLRLRLHLPQLGPLAITLTLRAARLDAGLQADSATSAATLREHLATLRQQLTAQQLEVASLYAGYRPLPPVPATTLARTAMICERG